MKTTNTQFLAKYAALILLASVVSNTVAATWTPKADMPTARMGFSTSVVDGKIYAISALQGGPNRLTKVEAYDPATDTWTE